MRAGAFLISSVLSVITPLAEQDPQRRFAKCKKTKENINPGPTDPGTFKLRCTLENTQVPGSRREVLFLRVVYYFKRMMR